MTETQIRLIKNKREKWADLLMASASLALFYYTLHPESLEAHLDIFWSIRDKLLYRVSVWQTQRMIRSLPETSEHLSHVTRDAI